MKVRQMLVKENIFYLNTETRGLETPIVKTPILLINSSKAIDFIKLDTIQLLEASGFKTIIHSESGDYCSGKPLSNFEFLESFKSFFRVTRSYIVNADKIVKVKNTLVGKGSTVLLESGLSFELKSATKCKELTDYLKDRYFFI